MHDNKLISAAVVLVVASVAWFIPAPEGLCRTSVYGEVTVRANKIAFDEKKKLRVGKVAELLSDTPPPRSDDQPTQAQREAVAVAHEAITSGDDAQETAQQLGQRSWRLFVIFAATILLILFNTMPIFTASLIALSLAIVTGTLTADAGYSGFSQGFIIVLSLIHI